MPRQCRLPILLALACTLFLRALVPAGWMPAAHGGAFAIEPCPAAEFQPFTSMAAHHGGGHDPQHHAQHDGDCSFAPLTTALAATQSPPAITAPRLISNPLPTRAVVPPFKTGPPALLPPATGPPAFA